MKRILPLCLLPFVAAAAAHTPRGLVVDDLTLLPPSSWCCGSLLLRAEVRNPTASDQRVRIRFGNDYNARWGMGDAWSDLVVPAGGRSLCEIPLPRCGHSGMDKLYAIDASGRKTDVSASSIAQYGGDYSLHDPLLFYLSRSLSGERLRDQLSARADALAKAGTLTIPSYRSELQMFVARAGDFAEAWPGDWRAYSVFAAVFIAERDAPDLPAAAKAALRDYAAAGGRVFFVGGDAPPPGFEDAPFAPLSLPADSAPLAAAVPPAVKGAARCGMGLLATVPDSVAMPGGGDMADDLATFLLRHALHAARTLGNPDDVFRKFFPSAASAGKPPRPPVGLFLLLLAAFAVLAGPVSIWRLARRNRRIHILWVLPAISAAFSAAILLALLLGEGVRPTVRLQSAVLLDQRAGRALVRSSASFYSPLTLGAIDFPTDASVSKQNTADGGQVEIGRTARYLGWIPPRTMGAFGLASVRATPLRLDVRRDPATGALAAVNAFGAPIESLLLFDDAGASWGAADVAPGATAALAANPTAGPLRAESLGCLLDALRYGNGDLSADAFTRPELPARRFYVAVLPAAPFEPDPLPGRTAKRAGKTIVYGVY